MQKIILNKYRLFVLLLITLLSAFSNAIASNSKVTIEKSCGKCILLVNGKQFQIKGAGFSLYTDKKEIDRYFKLAKEMGANAIRQWDITANEAEILDLAQKHGLMINLGLWISWNRSYMDTSNKEKETILDYVKKYKDHPALLLWNLGNENISKIQNEDEKIALSKYIENIAKEIHTIDPNHPIVYTDIVAEGIPYLKYMPSIDIYGFNAYAAIESSQEYAKKYHLDRPYIYSEFGPDGWWEVLKDENRAPLEPMGHKKAKLYADRWRLYIANKSNCFGGFAFLLNDKMEETKTWWGITYQGLRTTSFWALKKSYTGIGCSYSLPKIISLHVSKTSSIKPGSEIKIRITAGQGGNIIYNMDVPTIQGAFLSQKTDNSFIYKVPSNSGVYRIYAFVEDDKGNIDTATSTISVK